MSLEKAADIKVLNKFNQMRLQTYLKAIEDDRDFLMTTVKSEKDELSESAKIFKSCLFLLVYCGH